MKDHDLFMLFSPAAQRSPFVVHRVGPIMEKCCPARCERPATAKAICPDGHGAAVVFARLKYGFV